MLVDPENQIDKTTDNHKDQAAIEAPQADKLSDAAFPGKT